MTSLPHSKYSGDDEPMDKLNIDKEEAEFLNKAITHWQQEGMLDEKTADTLRDSYDIKQFDWKKLSQYSFWTALTCGLIAVCSLIFDKAILNLLENLYYTPNIIVSIVSGALAVLFYYWGQKNKLRHPERTISNEATIAVGVIFTGICVGFLGKSFDRGSGHFPLLILASSLIYFFLARRFNSSLIWTVALLALSAWFGAETGYLSDFKYHFLGMNYPLRFALWGALLTGLSFAMKRGSFSDFHKITYVYGMLVFFLSMWMLSIFGNYERIDDWAKVRQWNLFYWAILSTVTALGSMLYGLKYKNAVAREFGITFLLINLYSRYFEYFWDIADKALFFGILAISFWLIGRKAERIWHLK